MQHCTAICHHPNPESHCTEAWRVGNHNQFCLHLDCGWYTQHTQVVRGTSLQTMRSLWNCWPSIFCLCCSLLRSAPSFAHTITFLRASRVRYWLRSICCLRLRLEVLWQHLVGERLKCTSDPYWSLSDSNHQLCLCHYGECCTRERLQSGDYSNNPRA